MTKEAELNAEADKNRREQIEARNQLDSVVYQLEKTVKESGDKLSADVKGKIEAGLASAKKDLESNDAARMRAAVENLTKLGGEFYAQAQQAAPAGAGAASGGAAGDPSAEGEKKKGEKKSDVVDADFEVVDENNKKS
jgi:molecular chaperone DnaK